LDPGKITTPNFICFDLEPQRYILYQE